MAKNKFKAHIAHREGEVMPKSIYSGDRIDRVITGGTLFQYSATASGSRIGMGSAFMQSAVTIIEPTKRTQLSGVEQDYYNAGMSDDIDAENPVEVIDLIPKYTVDGVMVLTNPESYLITRDIVTNEIGITVIHTYKTNHAGFGFSLRGNAAVMEDLTVGTILTPGTKLNLVPSQLDDGNYGLGREADVIMVSAFGTNEDSGIACDTVREDFRSEQFDVFEIFADNSKYLLDILGEGDVYRPIPPIGGKVSSEGRVAVSRVRIKNNELFHNLKTSVKTQRIPFDVPYISRLNAEVVDVEVIRTHKAPKIKYCPDGHNSYLTSLWRKGLERYDRMVALDRKFRSEYGSNYKRSTLWHSYIREAKQHTMPSIGSPAEAVPTRGDMPVTGFYVKVVTRSVIHPNLGHKFVGTQGEKFVISEFRSFDNMYKDKWGRTAEFCTNSDALLGRSIPSVAFELYGSDAMFHLLRKTRIKLGTDGADVATEYYVKGLEVISTKTHYLLTKASKSAFAKHMDWILYHADVAQRVDEVGDLSLTVAGCTKIMNSEYRPPKSTVTFVDFHGNQQETIGEHRIASKTILVLDKIGRYSSACNAPLRTTTGFPKKISSREKKNSQMNEQANKDTGEAEARSQRATLRPGVSVMLSRMGLSAKAIHQEVDEILNGAHETDVDVTNIRSRGVELLASEFFTWGFKLTNKKSKFR